MGDVRQKMVQALEAIDSFIGPDLGARIADLEWSVKGCNGMRCREKSANAGVSSALLTAAYAVKRAAGQINIVVHAVGGLLLLPQILEHDEKIESVSLGAGNTGRDFDLETDRRVAEFKFIHWRGGAETMRKKSLFKDFCRLAEADTNKRKELYVLGTSHPLRFLRSGTALSSVMSKDVPLLNQFREKYGDQYATVGEYYAAHEGNVSIIDAAPLLPELVHVLRAAETEEEESVP